MAEPSQGFCDLHCHLLYGVDDGAKTVEESVAIARLMVGLGYSDVAPSPHNRPQYADRTVALERLREVAQALEQASVPLKLYPSAENAFVDDRLLGSLGTPEARPIHMGPYLLVEAPYSSPLPSLLDLVFRMKLQRSTAVIAHPERCLEFERPKRAREVVDRGGLLQLDISALVGRYGARPQKIARGFLDDGLYAVAASDVHSIEEGTQWLGRALDELFKRAGDDEARRLLCERPRKILQGQVLES